MAPFDSHLPRTGSAAAGGGVRGLVVGTVAGSLLLVAPIVVWTRVGNGGVAGMAAITVVAIGSCFALLRWITRRYVQRRLPARERVAPARTEWSPSTYRGHVRPRPTPARNRRNSASPHRCGPSRCRPAYVSRGARDVGCHASPRQRRRRTTRRRTRP